MVPPSFRGSIACNGEILFEVYKVVGAAQVILANANSSMVLKNVLVEMSLSDKQTELKGGLPKMP